MFRLFAMDVECRLFQLGSRGWGRNNGSSFPTVEHVRNVVYTQQIPVVPNEVGAYIARVDAAGLIVETFPVLGPAVQ